MANLRIEKIVASLPGTLTANTLYFVKSGAGFDQYLTNNTGTIIAYQMNSGGGGTQNLFIQDTEPTVTVESLWIDSKDGKYDFYIKTP